MIIMEESGRKKGSPSVKREWIEIIYISAAFQTDCVSLCKEGVD